MPFTGGFGNVVQGLGGLLEQGWQGMKGAFGGGDGGGGGQGGGTGMNTGMDLNSMGADDVKAMQTKLGVTVDGIVGPETQGAYDTWSSTQPASGQGGNAESAAKKPLHQVGFLIMQ